MSLLISPSQPASSRHHGPPRLATVAWAANPTGTTQVGSVLRMIGPRGDNAALVQLLGHLYQLTPGVRHATCMRHAHPRQLAQLATHRPVGRSKPSTLNGPKGVGRGGACCTHPD
jgi:hypothetical protein